MNNRGFQKISLEQWTRDTADMRVINYDGIVLPKRATKMSAGYDLYSPMSISLLPGEYINVPLGIKAYMMPDEVLMIYPRSGHGFKFFLRLANTTGIIDSDYYGNSKNEGHIWCKVRNEGESHFVLDAGTAIAQAVFSKYLISDDDNSDTIRSGGFGPTG